MECGEQHQFGPFCNASASTDWIQKVIRQDTVEGDEILMESGLVVSGFGFQHFSFGVGFCFGVCLGCHDVDGQDCAEDRFVHEREYTPVRKLQKAYLLFRVQERCSAVSC